MLSGKKIIVGITGSIAAYKSAFLVRSLIKSGAEVKVIMTSDATLFISPLTLSTLSKNPVITDLTDEQGNQWQNHVEHGLWADLFLIAPATANTIAKMATGICDNMLLATYLSAKCPVMIAPAMDLDMWRHPVTQENISRLKSFGNKVVNVGYGELASGLTGEGRMAEPEEILKILDKEFSDKKKLQGKKILITAGPTQEPIDPVRYISNHSSGKMGIALAEALAAHDAEVTLVLGPVDKMVENPQIKVISVSSAEEMYLACKEEFSSSDIFIGAAAVADFTPADPASQKIKKENGIADISLKKTKDILRSMAEEKRNDQLVIGFALETENEKENATKKLHDKNLDFIILNSLNDTGSGFKFDTNKISIIDRSNNIKDFELKPKTDVADDIVNYLIEYLHA